MRRWVFPAAVLLATCFGVFILPFLLPAHVIDGVSASNVAGFNNKVGAVAAAAMSVIVFFAAIKLYQYKSGERIGDDGRLSRWFVLLVVTFFGGVSALLSWTVCLSRARNLGDAGYFIEQASAYADYGRRLYTGIEFPYGPLLFYSPVAARALLSPWHISMRGAYFVTLVVEQALGLLLLAYTIDRLPMTRRWKQFTLPLFALLTIQFGFGLNYTFFRFAMPLATFIFAARSRRPWLAGLLFAAGAALNLAVSPEMGFAFVAGALAYAAYRLIIEGRTSMWPLVAPLAGAALFFWIIGAGYLRMLALFSGGIFNLIIEPLPHILLFLFALVWLVPLLLARLFRQGRPDAAMLAGLYVVSVGLLPVAFGRADAGHVFFNGLGVYLLSIVAMSYYPVWTQRAWALCVAAIVLWTQILGWRALQYQIRQPLHYDVVHYSNPARVKTVVHLVSMLSPRAAASYLSAPAVKDEPSVDASQLNAIVGQAKVATPYELPLTVEDLLKRTGRYVPSHYCFYIGVLDATAEAAQIRAFNEQRWALIPKGATALLTETPENTERTLGSALPYRSKRPAYVAGKRFAENLDMQWQPYASLGAYTVYRKK